MSELNSPNLMRVTGLTIFALGLILLTVAVTAFAHVAKSDADRAELTANRRTVGMWFGLPVLIAGIILQMVAEFIPTISPPAMVICLLGVAFWMLAQLMTADLIAERMLDASHAAEARRLEREQPVVASRPTQVSPPLQSNVA